MVNQRDEDDIKNYYVANRGRNSMGMYSQMKSGVKKHHSKKVHHKVVSEKYHKKH
jgi:hypothetical protein